LRLITQANSALVGGHPLMFSFFSSNSSTNCYAFSTYYSDQAGDQHYANDRYVFDKFNNTLESSDVFSSIYAYDQAAYYSSTGLVIVWICFALTLFGITALVYARTDVK
jgi:hypothetical protein